MVSDGRVKRGEATRATLLEACMTIIAEQGTPRATQRSVASAAGVSLASTTYHFGTRAGLLSATLEYAAATAIVDLGALREEIRVGEVGIVDACLNYIERQRSGRSRTAIVVFELAVAATREQALRSANEGFMNALRGLFAPFTADAPPGTDAAIAEALYGLLLTELARGEEPSPGLAITVRAIFDAFGVTESALRLTGAGA